MIVPNRDSHKETACPVCPYSEHINSIVHLLYGNGDEGIRTRLARMEERMQQIREDLLEMREKEFRHMEARLRWSITIFAAVASMISGILVKLFAEVLK